MTAIMMLRFDDRVEAYADTVLYNAHGVALSTTFQKVHTLFPQRTLLAVAGPLFSTRALVDGCAALPDFDTIVAKADELMARGIEIGHRMGEPVVINAAFAGWSRSAGAFRLAQMGAVGPTPWELEDLSLKLFWLDSIFSVPLLTPEGLARTGLVDADGVMDLREGDAAIVRLFNEMRATTYPINALSSLRGCIVGGSLQKFVLTEAGAITTMIHQWPDAVGELVGREIVDPDEWQGVSDADRRMFAQAAREAHPGGSRPPNVSRS